MKLLNKRNFLKICAVGIGGLLFKLHEKTSQGIKLVYRVEFPADHSATQFKQIKKHLFPTSFDHLVLAKSGLENHVHVTRIKTATYLEKTFTFSSQEHLQLYIKTAKSLNIRKTEQQLFPHGYKVTYKVIS